MKQVYSHTQNNTYADRNVQKETKSESWKADISNLSKICVRTSSSLTFLLK